MAKKLEVKVCVGSSCHVKGGSKTLRVLELLIEQANVGRFVDLKADLCLGNCLNAPNVVVDGEVHGGVTPELAETFFREQIVPRVQQ
ncbi:MAG: NAD(P)H-dependent oxidoreductase subunit E [Armatimonadota bacterium]